MSQIPAELRYVESHEWIRREDDGTMTIGITDHAQEQLGDLVFVELPELGRKVEKGEEFGVVESVKAASDIYSPLAGEIVAVNEALKDTPELINNEPYGEGWILRLQPDQPQDWEQLLDAASYAELVAQED